MTRHYARAWKNQRAVDKTPLNTPCNTTVLSSIRLNGACAYTVYQGGTTAERFAEYLKTVKEAQEYADREADKLIAEVANDS